MKIPLFLLASFALFGGHPIAAEAQRPNVVVLLADDLGWQDIGCYGGPVKTPALDALDALAAGGTRFTDFYSGCAVCSPSRASLLTGRHHMRTGVYSWISDASQRTHLLKRETTLAELLKAQGYSTAHVGKWHLGLPTEKFDKPDLEADPAQERNVAEANPEILTKLQKKLLEINGSIMADGADWHLP